MRLRTPFVITALVATAVACAGSDDDSSDDSSVADPPVTAETSETDQTDDTVEAADTADTADTAASSGSVSMVELLDRIPLSALEAAVAEESRSIQISMGDMLAAAELAELPRPDQSDIDESIQWYVDLSLSGPVEAGGTGYAFNGPTFPLFAQSVVRLEDFEGELGFTPFEIDTYVSLSAVPIEMAVLSGDLALSEDLVEVGDGIVTAGQGEDFSIDPAGRTDLRSIGRPHRLAESDGLVAVSLSTRLVEDWLAGEPSLADDPDLAAAAEALDRAGSVTGHVVVDDFSGFSEGDVPPSPITTPFGVVGIGTAEVEGAPGNVIVYVFSSSDDAAVSQPAIEEAWRDGVLFSGRAPIADFFEVGSVEQDDRVVAVTVNVTGTATTQAPLEMVLGREQVLTYDG